MRKTNSVQQYEEVNRDERSRLLRFVNEFLFKRLSGAINTSIKDRSAAKDKLTALLDFYHDRLVMSDTGGCPLMNFGAESDNTDPVIKSQVAKGIKTIQDTISRIVTDGIATGEFLPSVNADIFGVKMFNMLEGAILSCRVFHNKYHPVDNTIRSGLIPQAKKPPMILGNEAAGIVVKGNSAFPDTTRVIISGFTPRVRSEVSLLMKYGRNTAEAAGFENVINLEKETISAGVMRITGAKA